MIEPDIAAGRPADDQPVDRYAWYVLSVLVLVYTLNFIDRQILSILAEDIKRDLHLTDGDIGFLYGTAFGVFYALFGIPLGRLADGWHRVRLMSIGLALWSGMTALSGLANSRLWLTGARIGVGIGEATASPAAYSLISDWFPRRLRATALSIYSGGIFVGGGLSLGIGGLVVQSWNRAYPAGGPFGLVGWQAAFLAVGLPGLAVALWVATLREPARGRSEGIAAPPPHPAPFRGFVDELLTIVPPLTLIGAARLGGRVLALNLAGLALVCGGVALLVLGLGEPPAQWLAFGIGAYAVYSWALALRQRDPPAFALIVGNPAFIAVTLAYGLNAFVLYGMNLWSPPYAIRVLGAAPATAGAIIGAGGALAGFLGVVIGGRVADRLRARDPAGRLKVVIFGSIAPVLPIAIAFTTDRAWLFYAMLVPAQALASCALGAAGATTQDVVLPRMRGTATGTFFIGTTLLGLALGPYLAGRISTLTGDLATGVLSLLAVVPVGVAAGVVAYRRTPSRERERAAFARAAGEVSAPPG